MLEDKLQEEINENARLRTRQTEDAKLWKGIDSKISSTNALCDQLTETLQQLADQTRMGMAKFIVSSSWIFEVPHCLISQWFILSSRGRKEVL